MAWLTFLQLEAGVPSCIAWLLFITGALRRYAAAMAGRDLRLAAGPVGSTQQGLAVDGTVVLAQHVLLLEAPGLMISSSLDLPQLWRLRSVQREMRCLLDLRLTTLESGIVPDLQMDRETMSFEKIVTIFQAMLLHPPLLRAPDCAGRTPLLRAAQLGLPQLCAALLAAKAEVNARGGNGWTALHYAATGRSVETCRVLLDHGAQVEARSLDGCTPFYYAYRAGDEVELMQLLHARGARPDLRAQNAAGTADWGYLRYAKR